MIEKGCFALFGVPEDLFKGEMSVCFADIGLLTSLEALGDLFFFDGCILCVRLKRERNFPFRLFFFDSFRVNDDFLRIFHLCCLFLQETIQYL